MILISNEDEELDEELVMMDALEAGASDFEASGELFTVYTEPNDCTTVAEALEKAGYVFESAQVEMVPNDYIQLTAEKDIQNMEKMLDLLEEDEDVQNVWHNWEQE